MEQVREFPQDDSASRQNRAEQCQILDVREIEGRAFDVPNEYTIYEVDLLNEDGERRDNVTIIPRVLFESTKDVQHRHEFGIIGKYSLALSQHNEQAQEELVKGIREQRDQLSEEIRFLKEKDSRLLNFLCEINGL